MGICHSIKKKPKSEPDSPVVYKLKISPSSSSILSNDKLTFQNFGETDIEPIHTIIAANDNRTVVTCGVRYSIKIWDIKEKKCTFSYNKENRAIIITSAAITKNKNWLIISHNYNAIDIWDIWDKQLKNQIECPHSDHPNEVALAENEEYFLTFGLKDTTLKIWSFMKRALEYEIKNAHEKSIKAVQIAPDCKIYITGSEDLSIKIWSHEKKNCIHRFEKAHFDCISALSMMSNDYIVSGSNDCSIKLWSIPKKSFVFEFKQLHKDNILSLNVLQNGYQMLSLSKDRSIRIWELEEGSCVGLIEKIHRDYYTKFCITPNEENMITAGTDGKVKVWNLKERRLIWTFRKPHKKNVKALIFANRGEHFISVSHDSIKQWDLQNRQIIATFEDEKHRKWEYSYLAKLTSDEKTLITVDETNERTLRVWNFLERELEEDILTNHKHPIIALVFAMNDTIIVTSDENSVHFYNILKKSNDHEFSVPHNYSISCIAVKNDCSILITGSLLQPLKIWDVKTKDCIFTMELDHGRWTNKLLLTSDEDYLITGCSDETIKVWDLNNKRCISAFEKIHRGIYHLNFNAKGEINAIAITKDSRYLISGSSDKNIKILDLMENQCVHVYENIFESKIGFFLLNQGEITSIELHPSERFFLAGFADGTIKIFEFYS